jgi:hypothetical protein
MSDYPAAITRSRSEESTWEIWRPEKSSNLRSSGNIVQVQPTSGTFYPGFQGGIYLGAHYHQPGVGDFFAAHNFVSNSSIPIGAWFNTASLIGCVYTSFSAVSGPVSGNNQFLTINCDENASFHMMVTGGLSHPKQPVAHDLQPEIVEAVGQWPAEADQISRELGRLEAGWAGPGSLAPSDQAIRDFELVAPLLPLATVPPSVEVDESDGYISMRWRRTPGGASFTLVFNGKREVMGNLASGNTMYEPWKLSIKDEATIAIKLDHSDVRQAISGV